MNSSQLFSALLVAILTFNFATAQEKINLENSVLWRVEHPDLKSPSFIYGTFHLMCEDDYKIPEKVTEVLLNSDALVMEVNLSDPKEMQLIQESLSNPKKISEELSEEQFTELDSLVTKITQLPLSTYDAYGLSVLNMIMMTKMFPCSQFKSPENELGLLAKNRKIQILGLENGAEQMEIIKNAYPTEFALKQIMLFDSYKKDLNDAIVAYQNEEITTAVGLLTKENYMDENATALLLINRNLNWVEKMSEMMEKRSNLFAVGAAHLTEDYGILHLLRKKGYSVTPILN